MPLIKDGQLVENEWYTDDTEEVYSDKIIYPLTRFLEEFDAGSLPVNPIGVAIDVADDVLTLAGKLGKVALVTVNFPSFADGRGFSQARLIRDRLGFEGELRAKGHIIRDQYLYLLRCGVNAIDANRVSESEWQAAMEEFDVFYQPAMNKGTAAYHIRHNKEQEAA